MFSDTELKQAVLDELAWQPSITAAHIGVSADAGVITLSGHVESFVEKKTAEKAAGRVRGVKVVVEELEVRLPGHFNKGDQEIAAAAIERLAWDSSVPKGVVAITVEQGWVTLEGAVDWHFQKEAAERAVSGLLGVVAVRNQLTIRPRIIASDLSASIKDALCRSTIDPKRIKITTEGGKVSLSGTASSWSDRHTAGLAAWNAPGATAVENDISIV